MKVGDIVRGMIYLHDSTIRSHGRLHSANCVIDSRLPSYKDYNGDARGGGEDECGLIVRLLAR